MAELFLALAVVFGVRAFMASGPRRAAVTGSRAGPRRVATRSLAPKALRIEGAAPALLSREELKQHGLDPKEFADACFAPGPSTLAELAPAVKACLADCFKSGQVRGPIVSQLHGNLRPLQAGESVIFVLLDSAQRGPRVYAYVSGTPEQPPFRG